MLRPQNGAVSTGSYRHNLLILLCIFSYFVIFHSPVGYSQAIDTVDVQRRSDSEAEIIIRFATRVQYLRHAPQGTGSSVRIYVMLTGGGLQPGDLIPQTKRLPKQDSLPQTTISFPELDNSLLVSFEQPVRFSVSPGPDGRSIYLLVVTGTGK
jgi:hypothetical protein